MNRQVNNSSLTHPLETLNNKEKKVKKEVIRLK